jgi:hypothetical protein
VIVLGAHCGFPYEQLELRKIYSPLSWLTLCPKKKVGLSNGLGINPVLHSLLSVRADG